jgi:hypothetical protein
LGACSKSKNALPITVMIGVIVDRKFSRRTNVQRKSRSRPTEDGFANLTPLRVCRYFTDDDSRLVAGRICERNLNVAVCLDFYRDDAANKSEALVSIPANGTVLEN